MVNCTEKTELYDAVALLPINNAFMQFKLSYSFCTIEIESDIFNYAVSRKIPYPVYTCARAGAPVSAYDLDYVLSLVNSLNKLKAASRVMSPLFISSTTGTMSAYKRAC